MEHLLSVVIDADADRYLLGDTGECLSDVVAEVVASLDAFAAYEFERASAEVR